MAIGCGKWFTDFSMQYDGIHPGVVREGGYHSWTPLNNLPKVFEV